MEAINQAEKLAKKQKRNSEWRKYGSRYSIFALECIASGALMALSGFMVTKGMTALTKSEGAVVPIRKAL